MTTASEYLSLAALLMMSDSRRNFPMDRASLAKQFEETYSCECEAFHAEIIINQLVDWGAISVNRDRFAGETFIIYEDILLESIKLLKQTALTEVINFARYEGANWFKKVFDNKNYWNALYSESNNPAIELDLNDMNGIVSNIPASDRIVKIDHNQQTEFETATKEVIEEIEKDNSIDGDIDLRSRIIGQLKAGRELFRAGVFKAETLYLTMIVSLKLLTEKYKDHAIGAAASKLIDLIHESIGSLV